MKKLTLHVLFYLVLISLSLLPNYAYAKRPPWASPDPWTPSNPPSAPEPVSMILIGMGASGVVGYYIGRRKKNK